jgi:hypothetical protein
MTISSVAHALNNWIWVLEYSTRWVLRLMARPGRLCPQRDRPQKKCCPNDKGADSWNQHSALASKEPRTWGNSESLSPSGKHQGMVIPYGTRKELDLDQEAREKHLNSRSQCLSRVEQIWLYGIVLQYSQNHQASP